MLAMTTSHIVQHHIPNFGWLDIERQPCRQTKEQADAVFDKSVAVRKRIVVRVVTEEERKR